MKIFLKCPLLLLVFINISFVAIASTPKPSPKKYEWKEFLNRLENLSEKEINIGKESIELASEIFPLLDKEGYKKKIDKIVDGVKQLANGKTDPDYRVRALNTYLFKTLDLKYDYSDPLGNLSENRYIVGPLDEGKGNCVSLPLIYITVAQRLNYPVYAVAAPHHLFARYVDPKLKKQNIEPTGAGGYSPDSKYIRDFKITKESIENGAYLKTMSHREFLGELIAQNGVYWAKKGNKFRALEYFKTAIKMAPFNPEIYDNLGILYLELSNQTFESAKLEAELAQIQAINGNKSQVRQFLRFANMELAQASSYKKIGVDLKKRAKDMGLVRLSNDEYLKKAFKKYYETEKEKPANYLF